MSMRKIKKNDLVLVLTGKSKGTKGKVLKVVADGKKVYVEGANLIKKHVRPNPNANERGGIIEKEAAIAISNVALVDPTTQKAAKVGVRTLEDGRKVRYFKATNELVDEIK